MKGEAIPDVWVLADNPGAEAFYRLGLRARR